MRMTTMTMPRTEAQIRIRWDSFINNFAICTPVIMISIMDSQVTDGWLTVCTLSFLFFHTGLMILVSPSCSDHSVTCEQGSAISNLISSFFLCHNINLGTSVPRIIGILVVCLGSDFESRSSISPSAVRKWNSECLISCSRLVVLLRFTIVSTNLTLINDNAVSIIIEPSSSLQYLRELWMNGATMNLLPDLLIYEECSSL